MKRYILLFAFAFCSLIIHGQTETSTPEIGKVLEIGKPTGQHFKHINLPKANIIIKRGGIANYANLKSTLVIITSVTETENGNSIINIKRKDGKRFFGSHKYIAANFEEAIQSGELVVK